MLLSAVSASAAPGYGLGDAAIAGSRQRGGGALSNVASDSTTSASETRHHLPHHRRQEGSLAWRMAPSRGVVTHLEGLTASPFLRRRTTRGATVVVAASTSATAVAVATPAEVGIDNSAGRTAFISRRGGGDALTYRFADSGGAGGEGKNAMKLLFSCDGFDVFDADEEEVGEECEENQNKNKIVGVDDGDDDGDGDDDALVTNAADVINIDGDAQAVSYTAEKSELASGSVVAATSTDIAVEASSPPPSPPPPPLPSAENLTPTLAPAKTRAVRRTPASIAAAVMAQKEKEATEATGECKTKKKNATSKKKKKTSTVENTNATEKTTKGGNIKTDVTKKLKNTVERAVATTSGDKLSKLSHLGEEEAGCFEVELDISRGIMSTGITFKPGPDGRPQVSFVSDTGGAAGAVEVGDVLMETVVTVMMSSAGIGPGDADADGEDEDVDGDGDEIEDEVGGGVFLEQVWHNTNDSSFEDCMTAMRTNQRNIAMRLCRGYEPRGVIPLQTGDGLESWLETGGNGRDGGEGGSHEDQSGKAWAARNAFEVPLK